MSDNIPLEIQVEFMKRLPVKSLLQFRSVSKTWKSVIDSSAFVAEYSCQHTHTQHLLLRYEPKIDDERIYVSVVDDDTFPTQRVYLPPPNLRDSYYIVGCSHGLFCLRRIVPDEKDQADMAILWNPSIRKTVDVFLPNVANGEIYDTILGFGVCRETNDPKIVKITHLVSWTDVESARCIPWQVEVFTLSTGTWRSLDGNLPRKLVEFHFQMEDAGTVVIDGVIYWLVTDRVTDCNLIISFDTASECFGEVNLPNELAICPLRALFSGHAFFLFKLRESLVLVHMVDKVGDRVAYDLWLMHGGVPESFTKLSTYPTTKEEYSLGFRRSGGLIIEIIEAQRSLLAVYDPHSKRIDDLGIDGWYYTFYVHPYMETLFLLDQPNHTVHN